MLENSFVDDCSSTHAFFFEDLLILQSDSGPKFTGTIQLILGYPLIEALYLDFQNYTLPSIENTIKEKKLKQKVFTLYIFVFVVKFHTIIKIIILIIY
jgi:hypothetical protein